MNIQEAHGPRQSEIKLHIYVAPVGSIDINVDRVPDYTLRSGVNCFSIIHHVYNDQNQRITEVRYI